MKFVGLPIGRAVKRKSPGPRGTPRSRRRTVVLCLSVCVVLVAAAVALVECRDREERFPATVWYQSMPWPAVVDLQHPFASPGVALDDAFQPSSAILSLGDMVFVERRESPLTRMRARMFGGGRKVSETAGYEWRGREQESGGKLYHEYCRIDRPRGVDVGWTADDSSGDAR